MKDVAADVYWDNFGERAKDFIEDKPIHLRRLTLHLTDDCNMACIYCNMRRGKNYFDPEQASELIKSYSEMPGMGKLIHFTGGEPTLHPEFEQLAFQAWQSGLEVTVSTNAFITIGDLSPFSKIKCSLDDYQRLENIYKVPKCTERIFDTLEYYNANIRPDQVFSITCVISNKNFFKLGEISEHICMRFDNLHNLYFTSYKGTDTDNMFTEAGVNYLWTREFPQVMRAFKRCGHGYSAKQLSLYVPSDFTNPQPGRFPDVYKVPCYLQLGELTIGVNYQVYDCSHLYRDDEEPVCGLDIRTTQLKDAYRKAKSASIFKIPVAPSCASGCNRNLHNFNKYVDQVVTEKLSTQYKALGGVT